MSRFEVQMPSAKALNNKTNHIFQVLFVTVCCLSLYLKMLFVIIMSLNANVIPHNMLSLPGALN